MIVLTYNTSTLVPLNVNQYKTLTGQTYYTFRLVSNKEDDIVFTTPEITGTTRSSNFNITISASTNITGGTINITNNQEYLLYVYQTKISGNTNINYCYPLKNGTTFDKTKDFLIIQKVYISGYVNKLSTKSYSGKLKIKSYNND